ncbi:DNA topoisomerase IV subunit A [Derxia gummosa]|uniref:DNA topoisomerase 4 subunit A n=1 Tax=Derxia gummosa DSM 723 TaxID=1121388 RepID=A0A9U5FYP2_9BURK|nr:DNA topoisomerase IV subunit A [Derxia gummosa]
MTDLFTSQPASDSDALTLARFAERAYLDYAISVVKGRALPDVADGQKPVQRRILYAMREMGLGFAGNTGAKPRKSAAVVGDVLGKLHPHGDTSVYDALVRMAQDFSLRYPLIDGQGNFGSRDGDGAAAMRYTEARLSRISNLLLDELDEGTVDFAPNYDGTFDEPRLLPARLPMVLLNGASGIAVGLATEIPSHNLREVAQAAVAMIQKLPPSVVGGVSQLFGTGEAVQLAAKAAGRDGAGSADDARSVPLGTDGLPRISGDDSRLMLAGAALARAAAEIGLDAVMEHIPGPDFPGGAQLISSPADIRDTYASGRGSLKLRARWKIEDLARGQWQLVVTELPPGTSGQKVLEEIEELTNPKIKAGKKALSPEQQQLKAQMLGLLDAVRDESGKAAPVRLVFEPKSRNIDQAEFANTLLAHTSLESSAPVNLVMVGRDGRPRQKNLVEILSEWVAFRVEVVTRRTHFRLRRVDARIHILEGRLIAFLNIDEVIKVIREADDPKVSLMERFKLSEIQAEDILEIRLRQLARLERIKIEGELDEKRKERAGLADLLANPGAMKRALVKEIEADAKACGDDRRTLIQADKRASVEVKVVDEPVTVVISDKGWLRARQGQGHDKAQFTFKAGDSLYATFECRTVDTLVVLGSNGRVYNVAVSALPGARGDGQPVTSFIDLESGSRVAHMLVGPAESGVVLATTAGYGFAAKLGDMTTRQRAGKSYVTIDEGAELLRPHLILPGQRIDHVAALSANGRLLAFGADELKHQPGGGRGVTLIDLEPKEKLLDVIAFARAGGVSVVGTLGGKERVVDVKASIDLYIAKRGRKGRAVDARLKTVDGLRLPD